MLISSRSAPSSGHRPTGSLLGVSMVAPAVLMFLGLVAVPVLGVIIASFTEWTGFSLTRIRWLGLDNYTHLFSDETFRQAFIHTVVFAASTALLLNAVGFALALLINTRVRGTGLLKAILFMPVLLSPVVVGLMWSSLLRGVGGGLNVVLEKFGIITQPIFWLGDQRFALAAVILATVWQFAGYDMILYFAGLQSVPNSLLESAELDGASYFARLVHVVLPSLYSVMSVIVLLNIIGGVRIFDIVYVMTRGGPNRSTEVLGTYMYEQAFQLNAMGYASAIAVTVVLMAVGVSVVRLRVLKRVG